MKKLTTIGSIATLGALLIAVNFGGSAGCSSSAVRGATSESTNAEAAGSAASTVASNVALSMALGGSVGLSSAALTTSSIKSQIASGLKTALTVSETSTCEEGTLPSPTGTLLEETTITASEVGGTSGSCTVVADGTETDTSVSVEALLTCDNLVISVTLEDTSYEVTLDGALGVEADVAVDGDCDSGECTLTIDMGLTSQDLSVSVDDETFDLVMNMTESVEFTISGSSVTGSYSAEGCETVDGSGYSVTGSESF